MYLIDYHLHTARCGHAEGSLADYINKAKEVGLQEIGFADHLPLFHKIDQTLTMSWDDFPLYLAEVKKVQKEERQVKIKLGIEADYVPGYTKQLQEVLAGDESFDYVLGSVHFLDGWGFDDRRYADFYEHYTKEELYEKYFALLIEAAETGLFDIMAHPDLIKKYNFRLPEEPVHLYQKAARAFARCGVAIEVSSAGLRKDCQEIYPSLAFLSCCQQENVPVTLGSDAHKPLQVGQEFDQLLDWLKKAGYTEIAVFTKRKKSLVAL